jgi:serine/threonine-protein kinase
VRRHRGGVAVALVALLAMAAFTWRLGVERNRALEAEALAEQRRVAAEQSAATAQGTLDFFARVLAEIAPEETATRTVTVDEWLARAAVVLSREDAVGAGDAALLGGYLGALHGSLGDTAAAITRLEPALAAMESRGLERSALYAGLASTLAAQMLHAGRMRDAAAWSNRAAGAWRALADGGDALAPVHASMAVGYAHYVVGELDPAVEAYRGALSAAAGLSTIPAARGLRAESAYMLGGILKALGNNDEALAVLDAGLAGIEADGDAWSTAAVRLHRNRSEVLSALGRSEDALQAIELALRIEAPIFGRRGVLYASLMNQKGIVLNELARFRESREAFAEALRSHRAATGEDDTTVRINLANVCDSVGDNRCAREAYERLLADAKASAALLPQMRRQLRQMLGRSMSQAGDYDGARAVLQAVLPEAIAEDGAASPNAAAILLHLARNEQRAGRWRVALDDARRAREAYSAMLPPGHLVFLTIDRIEGDVALGQGRLGDAERLLEGYHDATVAADGPDSVWAALAGLDLARLRHAQRRDDEARTLLRRHLPKTREVLLPTHPDRAAAEALARQLQVD